MRREAEAAGIPADWIDAARRSPVYALAMRYRVALPLHPEYRTLPMVWYVPPLSPVMGVDRGRGQPRRPGRRLPGDRPPADPDPLPVEPARRGRRRGCAAGAQAAGGDAPLHARAVDRRGGRRVGGGLGRAWASATWRTCTACWRWPGTTSASSSRRPTPSWRGRSRPTRAPADWTSPADRADAARTAARPAPRRPPGRSTSARRAVRPRLEAVPGDGGCGGGACGCGTTPAPGLAGAS